MHPKLTKFFFIVFVGFVTTSFIDDTTPPKVFPFPPSNENSLFYIQRTKNTNTIIYEVNRKPDGKINPLDPVKIYWLRYATDSTTADLTLIQRKYAYGVSAKPISNQQNSFVLQLVAYKKRNVFLLPVGNENRYAAFMSINGKLAELRRIFVSISGGTFWFPKVDYVELSGLDPTTRQKTVERFIPN